MNAEWEAAADVVANSVEALVGNSIANLSDAAGLPSAPDLGVRLEQSRNQLQISQAILVETTNNLTEKEQMLETFKTQGRIAKYRNSANCGEIAAFTFMALYRNGVFPLDMWNVPQMEAWGNHTFVTVGRPEGGETQYIENWETDNEMVICDPWMKKLMQLAQKPNPTAVFGPDDYRPHVEEYAYGKDKVKNLLHIDAAL